MRLESRDGEEHELKSTVDDSTARKNDDLLENDLRPLPNNAFARCENMANPVPTTTHHIYENLLQL